MKYSKNLDLLFISVIGFTAINFVFGRNLTPSTITGIRCIMGCMYFYSLSKLVIVKQSNLYGKWLVILLLLVNCFIIFRADMNLSLKDFIQNNVFSLTGIVYYSMPLLVFIPKTKIFYYKLFKYLIVWMYIGLVGYLINLDTMFVERDTIETTFTYSGMIVPLFLLLFSHYLKIKIKIICWLTYAFFLTTSIFMARRNLVITGLEYFSMFMISQFIYNKNRFNLIILIVCIIPIGYILISQDSLNKKLRERATEDSRSGVEDYFISDFKKDTKAIIWGRGLNGSYAQTYTNNDETFDERPGIETGYLNMILKGGLIQTIIISCILLLAIIKGFMQKSILASFSLFLLPLIVDNYSSSSISQWSAKCFIMWICIGICLNKHIISNKKTCEI